MCGNLCRCNIVRKTSKETTYQNKNFLRMDIVDKLGDGKIDEDFLLEIEL
jgi:hypothetical protein